MPRRTEGEIFFHDKHKLKCFMIINVVQNKILEAVLYTKKKKPNKHIHEAIEWISVPEC